MEYVNCGYGVKNPLLQAVGPSTPHIESVPININQNNSPGLFKCRVCSKVSSTITTVVIYIIVGITLACTVISFWLSKFFKFKIRFLYTSRVFRNSTSKDYSIVMPNVILIWRGICVPFAEKDSMIPSIWKDIQEHIQVSKIKLLQKIKVFAKNFESKIRIGSFLFKKDLVWCCIKNFLNLAE